MYEMAAHLGTVSLASPMHGMDNILRPPSDSSTNDVTRWRFTLADRNIQQLAHKASRLDLRAVIENIAQGAPLKRLLEPLCGARRVKVSVAHLTPSLAPNATRPAHFLLAGALERSKKDHKPATLPHPQLHPVCFALFLVVRFV